jgi:hypothetical protein
MRPRRGHRPLLYRSFLPIVAHFLVVGWAARCSRWFARTAAKLADWGKSRDRPTAVIAIQVAESDKLESRERQRSQKNSGAREPRSRCRRPDPRKAFRPSTMRASSRPLSAPLCPLRANTGDDAHSTSYTRYALPRRLLWGPPTMEGDMA